MYQLISFQVCNKQGREGGKGRGREREKERGGWFPHCTDGWMGPRYAKLLGITELELGTPRETGKKGVKQQGEISRPLSQKQNQWEFPGGLVRPGASHMLPFAVQEDQDPCSCTPQMSVLSYTHSQALKFALRETKEMGQDSGWGSCQAEAKEELKSTK